MSRRLKFIVVYATAIAIISAPFVVNNGIIGHTLLLVQIYWALALRKLKLRGALLYLVLLSVRLLQVRAFGLQSAPPLAFIGLLHLLTLKFCEIAKEEFAQ